MTLSNEERSAIVKHRLQRAKETLVEAVDIEKMIEAAFEDLLEIGFVGQPIRFGSK